MEKCPDPSELSEVNLRRAPHSKLTKHKTASSKRGGIKQDRICKCLISKCSLVIFYSSSNKPLLHKADHWFNLVVGWNKHRISEIRLIELIFVFWIRRMCSIGNKLICQMHKSISRVWFSMYTGRYFFWLDLYLVHFFRHRYCLIIYELIPHTVNGD